MNSFWRGGLATVWLVAALGACGGDEASNSGNNCDACGVCDNNPANDCKQDCANAWVGEAVLDNCGVCDADPSNDCVQDCAGEWGGSATEDACGICDADPTNDCDPACTGDSVADACGVCDADPSNDCVQDCAGEWGGEASEDMCGTCDADATNDCVQDCAGEWGGDAMLDNCGTCDTNPDNDCPADCNGDFGGDAVVDNCGTCDNDPSNDCVQDCAGTWGGQATTDMCGTCDADPSNDCVLDCTNVWGGPNTLDMCGTCDADSSNDCVQDCSGVWGGNKVADMCGTCDADATNDCVQDCAGVWGGTAALDGCGMCAGGTAGNSTCTTIPYNLVADASVDAATPGTNYGSATSLTVNPPWASASAEQRVYLRFDVSAVPQGSVVMGAKLKMLAYNGWAYGGDGNVYTHYVADDTWGETTITWANKPAASGTRIGYWWLWYNNTANDQWGVNASDDLTTAVREDVLWGNKVVSLMLSSPGYRTFYRSREYANAAQRPVLEVSWAPATTIAVGPEADATVSTTNDGAAASVRVRSEIYSGAVPALVRFNLASIPPGAVIQTARLEMVASSGYAWGNDGNVYVHLVSDDNWGESTVTTSNVPSHDATALGSWWLWYNNTPSDQVGSMTSASLRDAVREAVGTDKAISFLLRSPGYDTNYYSRESADAAKRPKLYVTYTMP